MVMNMYEWYGHFSLRRARTSGMGTSKLKVMWVHVGMGGMVRGTCIGSYTL